MQPSKPPSSPAAPCPELRTYRDDGTKIVVVGTAGEIDARDAPAGILLSVLISTGPCPEPNNRSADDDT